MFMGVTILNNSGWRDRVELITGSQRIESGMSGRGACVSEASISLHLGGFRSSQMNCLRKAGVDALSLALPILSASSDSMGSGAAAGALVGILAGGGTTIAHALVPPAACFITSGLAGCSAALL